MSYQLLCLNCQCLTNSKIDLITSEFLENKSLQFLCLSEIWLTDSNIDHVNFPDFYNGSSFCRSCSRGGGVGIWCRSGIKARKLDLGGFCIEKHFEICGVSFINCEVKTVIISCYRSCVNTDFAIFIDKFNDLLEFLYEPNLKLIICGDFNIDPIRDEKEYKLTSNLLKSYDIFNTVQEKTRLNNTLDYVFTNCARSYTITVDVHFSDHKGLLYTGFKEDSKASYTYKRDINKCNLENFISQLTEEDWSDVYKHNDLNDAFDSFYRIFEYYLNVNFPMKKFYTKQSKMWVDGRVKSSSKELKNLSALSRIFPELNNYYRECKNQHNLLVQYTKRNFYQNKINCANNKIKVAWNIINELTNKTRSKSSCDKIRNKGILIENPSEIATEFNKFFVNTPTHIQSQIPKRKYKNSANINPKTIFLFPFINEELFSLINNRLKPKNSSGYDDISASVMKKGLKQIVEPLTYLVNLSFSNGSFPSKLKVNKIIPIHKKGDTEDMGNYRPIALTPVFSKIFEYCFLERLLKFLDKHSILNDNQFGFRRKRSTNDAVYAFLKSIVEFIESGDCPTGIFCDLSKAFDCVSHDLILIKLERIGIRGKALKWVRDYLKNRSQFVSINPFDGNSPLINNEIGVPQGSILGPVLFILFVNDFFELNHNLFLYADDASAIVQTKDNINLETRVQECLEDMYDWFCSNLLLTNLEKTGYLVFHNYNKKINIDVNIGGVQLQKLNHVKFLGMNIDENLNWKAHCESVSKILNSVCYMLRNLKRVLSIEQLLSVYNAQVSSRLRYGVTLWGTSSAAAGVFLTQKRLVRCIAGVSQKTSCKPYFKQYEILTLPSIVVLELATAVFIRKDSFVKNCDNHHYNTRNQQNFVIPNFQYRIGRQSPFFLGLKIFNCLSDDVKKSKNVFIFKGKLKKILLKKCYYSIEEFLI